MHATRLILAATAVFLAACSVPAEGDPPPVSSTTSTAPTLAAEVVVECSNVERAYNAWEWQPATSADWALTQVKLRLEDGQDFLAAVTGYTDQAALDLGVAVADYNYQLALVQAAYTIEGSADVAPADDARVAVVEAYEVFERSTCTP